MNWSMTVIYGKGRKKSHSEPKYAHLIFPLAIQQGKSSG